ncbi:MAG: hypothetical protein NDF52_01155 [archaeon YNP-WB-062]|nr:hypothetical protein [Candidatus Culexarchaeum yellowstonense]
MRWYETEGGKLVIEDIDQDAVLLLWVAEKFKIDLRVLLFLFDKYGKDLWFFFYLFAGLVVKFPSLERFLRAVKDVQKVFSGMKIDSAVGKFAEKVIERGSVEFDLNDRERFPLGRLGLYESEGEEMENGGENFIEKDEREVK